MGIARITRGIGGAMKMYDIYTSDLGGTEAVKKGWSWPGFFFTWIWAFVKKLNGLGAGVLIVGVFLNIASSFDLYLWLIYDIFIMIWLGSSGNTMRATNLKRRGYQFAHMVSAQTAEAAIGLFIQEQNSAKQAHSDEAATVTQSQQNDLISKLINCPDCDKKISRKAASCPHCGCPIDS